jgi:hypothetical protein
LPGGLTSDPKRSIGEISSRAGRKGHPTNSERDRDTSLKKIRKRIRRVSEKN